MNFLFSYLKAMFNSFNNIASILFTFEFSSLELLAATHINTRNNYEN